MNEAVLKAAARHQPLVSQEMLERLKAKVAYARDIEALVSDLSQRLKDANTQLQLLYQKDLPDLMDEAGVDKVGLPASGNLPAMDAELRPFYSANIAASWDEDRRQAAFNWLEEHGHGDLIKTDVTLSYAREDREEAKEMAEDLRIRGYTPQLKEGVHAQTLSAWLREQIEDRHHFPPLETIGGSVGRVVRLKERKS